MNRTILSLIVAGMFTSFAGQAAAQNVTAGETPGNAPPSTSPTTDPMAKSPKVAVDPMQLESTPVEPGAKMPRPAASAKHPRAKGKEHAANAAGTAEYTAAKDKAGTDYKNAKAKCDALQGDAVRTCKTDAKAARTQALAEAKTQWQGRKGGHEAGGGMQEHRDEMKSDMRSGLDAAPEASKPASGMKPVQGNGASDARSDRRAEDDAIQARYEEAMANCGPLDVAARHACMMMADRARTEALADPDWQQDSQGGRLRKSRDDSIVPDAEKFQNVSTARKAPDGGGAAKQFVN